MDKADWFESRENLIKLLDSKKKELEKNAKDIAEIEYCIELYAKKVGNFKPEPKPAPIGI
jgi:hypothetical protein